MTQYQPTIHTQLTEAQRERLVLLIEECTEVIQAATKTLRWGYDNTHPHTGEDNRHMVLRELGDLATVLLLIQRADDLLEPTPKANQNKMVKLRTYTLHQDPLLLGSVLK